MEQAKARIILIAYYFPPHSGIGGIRPFRFYKYLKALGYQCTVITASAQPAGALEDIVVVPDETGKIWAAAEKQRLSPAAQFERLFRRFGIPACTGVIWAKDVTAVCIDLIGGSLSGRPVVLFTTYPPLGTLLAGLMVTWRRPVRWICDFRDPMSLLPTVQYYSAFSRFLARRLEGRAFVAAGAVIANTKAMAREWSDVYPRARRKLHVIFNGFDPEQQPRARPIPPRSWRILLHAGELYAGRSPKVILESLARLRQTSTAARGIRVLLQGSIGYAVDLSGITVDEAVRDGWIEIRDQNVPRCEALRLTEESDGLLLLQPQSALQVPGKLFDYICVGRPILALVPRFSAVEEILTRAEVPHVCVYTDDGPDAVDLKLLQYIDLPSDPQRFSDSFEETFSVIRQTRQLSEIIDSLPVE
jgi:glycosyltransferase involved in cell wall biosynthesis